MEKACQFFRTLLCWIFTLFVAIMVLLSLCVGNKRKVWQFWVRAWSGTIIKILKLKLLVTGQENLKSPAIVAMNHESILDIFVLPAVAPGFATFLAKKEVQKIPLVGRAMKACGCIFVDRSKTERAVKSIQDGLRDLPEDASILLYPEGTRSRNFTLRPLKKGIAHIAVQSKLPVITIGQYGMEKVGGGNNNLFFKPGILHLHVSPQIDTSSWSVNEIDEHIEEITSSMKDAISIAKKNSEKK